MNLHLFDVCLPDYWQGMSLPHLAVPVTSKTTITRLRDSLLRELDRCEPEDTTGEAYRQLKRTIKRFRLYPDSRYLFPDIPPTNDEDDSVMAFFVITD